MSDERTYHPSWSQALQGAAFVIVVSLLPQVSSVIRGKPNAGWLTILLAYASFAAAVSFMFRLLLRVHVSTEGIRGTSSRRMQWTEITEVTPNHLGGFTLSAVHAPTIMLMRSIARNADFRAQVLQLVPADHLLAKALARASAEDQRAAASE